MTKLFPDAFLEVQVTQEDIDRSPRNSVVKCSTCPISRALGRALGKDVLVFEEQTAPFNLMDGDMRFVYNHNGRAFIEAFDAGLEVKPTAITFTLDKT